MEISFTAEQITGLAVMMNNCTVPFLGLSTILPYGVENVYKWKPSFMFDKVIIEAKSQFEQKGILETYQFTNLINTMLKAKCQISVVNNDSEKPTEAIFLSGNNTAGKMIFNSDNTYTMSDGYEPKALVQEFKNKINEKHSKVYLREQGERAVKIDKEDLEEIFNLVNI